MSDTGSKAVPSEDELGEKWDRCIADSILKTGTGLGLGLVFSLLLFKRRPWPVALGTGFGLGYAVSNCQHDFRRVPTVHLRPVKVKAPGPPPTQPPSATQASEAAPVTVTPSSNEKPVSDGTAADTPTSTPTTTDSTNSKS